jgi:N-acetylglucosaminyldiphosphoundecaprenol N-acetyl-beta-D-mannosaminyltransferase
MNEISSQKTAARDAKRKLFGIDIDNVGMVQAVDNLRDWIQADQPATGCRYVVTPNVDHAVLLQENAQLRAAYDEASLILADGHPIVWASHLVRSPLPERVPGSELVPKLFDAFEASGELKVFLLGAAEGVAFRAAENMKERWPRVKTVGIYSPPLGFENDKAENQRILNLIAQAQPDVVIVGLGAPKQELWVHQHHKQLKAKTALCVGATIDFLAGEKKRAPVWMQRCGIEWLHRMCSEPKRLVKRYAKDAWIFPQLVLRQMFGWERGAASGR